MHQPIDLYSWEANAKKLVDDLPRTLKEIADQQRENTTEIQKLKDAKLVHTVAQNIRKGALVFIGGLTGSALTLAIPYLLKYLFHITAT